MGNVETTKKFSRLKIIIKRQPLEVFYKKPFLKNFAILTGKQLRYLF